MRGRFPLSAALLLASLALYWTAWQHGGVTTNEWYGSCVLVGASCVFAAFCRGPAESLRPWLHASVIGLGCYLLLQLLPLPGPVLRFIDPNRASMLDAVRGAVPIADWAPIAVNLPGAILWSTVLFVAGALFFVIRRASGGSHNLWAIIPLLTAALLEALIGLLQVAGGALYGTGTFNSRDHYCCFLELSLPLLGAAGWISVRQAREGSDSFLRSAVAAGMAWSAGLVILAGIFYSLSRAGAAVSLAGLAVFGALSMTPYLASRRARIGLATVLGLSVVIALVAFTPNALLSRFFQTAGADSATRLVFWKESLPIISHFPFVGTGLLGFESVFLHYQDIILTKRVDFAHNDYLQYLIELGFVGSILLVAVLAGVIGPVFKGAWKARDAQVRIWLAGCVGSFTALALHSAIDFNLYVPANVLAFAWIAGYASALTAARTGVRSLRRV